MANNELRSLLCSRTDGYWELLATAGGHEDALSKTMKGLTDSALKAGTRGPALSPNLVDHRIQALAAHDPRTIEVLAGTWEPPEPVTQTLLSSANDFRTAAWCASLRFLHELGFRRPRAEGVALELQEEIEVVFGARKYLDIDAAIHVALMPTTRYVDLRQIILADAGAATVDLRVIQHLLGDGPHSGSALERLRIFRDAPQALSLAALQHLDKLLIDLWPTQLDLGHIGGLLNLMSVVLSHPQRSAETYSHLIDRLRGELESSENPIHLLPFAYLLADTKWKCW
jgi:hypothetical protein